MNSFFAVKITLNDLANRVTADSSIGLYNVSSIATISTNTITVVSPSKFTIGGGLTFTTGGGYTYYGIITNIIGSVLYLDRSSSFIGSGTVYGCSYIKLSSAPISIDGEYISGIISKNGIDGFSRSIKKYKIGFIKQGSDTTIDLVNTRQIAYLFSLRGVKISGALLELMYYNGSTLSTIWSGLCEHPVYTSKSVKIKAKSIDRGVVLSELSPVAFGKNITIPAVNEDKEDPFYDFYQLPADNPYHLLPDGAKINYVADYLKNGYSFTSCPCIAVDNGLTTKTTVEIIIGLSGYQSNISWNVSTDEIEDIQNCYLLATIGTEDSMFKIKHGLYDASTISVKQYQSIWVCTLTLNISKTTTIIPSGLDRTYLSLKKRSVNYLQYNNNWSIDGYNILGANVDENTKAELSAIQKEDWATGSANTKKIRSVLIDDYLGNYLSNIELSCYLIYIITNASNTNNWASILDGNSSTYFEITKATKKGETQLECSCYLYPKQLAEDICINIKASSSVSGGSVGLVGNGNEYLKIAVTAEGDFYQSNTKEVTVYTKNVNFIGVSSYTFDNIPPIIWKDGTLSDIGSSNFLVTLTSDDFDFKKTKRFIVKISPHYNLSNVYTNFNFNQSFKLYEIAVTAKKQLFSEKEKVKFLTVDGVTFCDPLYSSQLIWSSARVANNYITNPIDIVEYLYRKSIWTENSIIPIGGPGNEYAVNSKIGNSFTDIELTSYCDNKKTSVVVDIGKKTTDIINDICGEIGLISYSDANRYEQLKLAYGSFYSVKDFTYSDIINIDNIKISDPIVSEIYCEPIVYFNYNPFTKKYTENIAIKNTSSSVFDVSYVDTPYLTDNEKEDIWLQCRELYLYAGVINIPNKSQTEITISKSNEKNATIAISYLKTWIRTMFLRTLSFDTHFDNAININEGDYFTVNFPHQTNSDTISCMAYDIEYSLTDSRMATIKAYMLDKVPDSDDYYDVNNISYEEITDSLTGETITDK